MVDMTTISLVDEFNRNAGKIWNILNTQGPLSETRLMNVTMLNENALYAAIGWLAREDKVRKDVFTYKLGGTNLTSKIGADAGKIWSILTNYKEIDISSIGKILADNAKINEKDTYAALGWLAREGKIETKNIIRPKS